MQFSGKILKHGQVVLDPVHGTLAQIALPNGRAGWRGEFALLAGQSIRAGMHELALDDGRSGNIIVNSILVAQGQPTTVLFKGSGALQRAPR